MAYMSEEGYQKLVAELKQLESVERPKVVAAIAEARDKGDLSENAEYDAAKEAQAMLEMKINQLKATIGDAKIIDTSKLKADTVQILSRVELKNVKTGMKMAYTIVSETEANLKQGKISVNTPIAQGLLGKKVGDVRNFILTSRASLRKAQVCLLLLYIKVWQQYSVKSLREKSPAIKWQKTTAFMLSSTLTRW